MAVSAGRKFVDGNNIMLFSYTSSGYKSIAHASSHTLSLTAESEDINTKDAGAFAWTEPGVISWSISVDSFYTNEGYSLFFDKMIAKEDLKVAFGLKLESEWDDPAINKDSDDEWTPNNSYVYYGTVAKEKENYQRQLLQLNNTVHTLLKDNLFDVGCLFDLYRLKFLY